jgi:hypothetical protein
VPAGSSSQHFGIGGWFNTAAFADPAFGTFGTARRSSLTGPGYANVDFSLGKEFPIMERLKLEIRADAYNAFNHVNYANPDANVGYSGCASLAAPCGASNGGGLGDQTAGISTGPANNSGMRIIQLGARFIF